MGKLVETLKKKVVIGDGAMGTLLYSYGRQSCFEELNSSAPEKIIDIHKQYIEAGANVIQTNTYGANEGKLRLYGLEERVKQLNVAAVKNAKLAAREDAIILGTIGGINHPGNVNMSAMEREYMLLEQATILMEEGVDGLLFETFYDEQELKNIVKLIRAQSDIDVVAQVSFQEIGVMQSGAYVENVLKELREIGANVVGMNCRLGPLHMLEALKYIPMVEDSFLSAYPNATMPRYVDGIYQYEGDGSYFEDTAKQFVEQGVRLLGGCCGTTPLHIASLKRGIKGCVPPLTKVVEKRKQSERIIIRSVDVKHKIVNRVQIEQTVIVELDPPKNLNTKKFFEGAKALKRAGATAITMADNSLASPRISNIAMASQLKQSDIPVIAHLTCRDRNLIGLQSHLLGLSSLGIHDILAITGDPARIGDFPGATSVYDVSSIELIRLIKGMNEGMMYSGKKLETPTRFSIGAAFNPNVKYIDAAVKRLEKKIDAGADYFLTQPIYDEETIIKTYEATRHINKPIFLGIMPLVSKRNADYLHYEVPGITLSEEVRKRMELARTPEEASLQGLEISKQLLDVALRYFNGIYLITPFLRYELCENLLQYIETRDKIGVGFK
ncbi:MAG: bifunctional homocysteine S-methyltransferase/methylenetetrahydrofolate reductase [Bacillaceae bacterium]